MNSNNGRAGKVKKSVFTTLLLQIVTIICGLIAPRLLLETYGSEAYGATTSIAQFLSYITLLEGGIGSVARAALYKPLAEGDTKRISLIVNELKRFFKVLAFISIGYTMVLACLFKTLSHIECYNWLSTFLLVLSMAVSTFGQYFIGISYLSLIQADQKLYLINRLSIITTIFNTIMVIMLIRLKTSLIFVKLVSSAVYLLKPTAMWLYVNRHYGLIKIIERDKNALSQRWTGLGQHIAYYIHSNTDVAVLTILDNLKTVSVYSVYNMISSHIQNFIVALCSGMSSVFGDMYARAEKENLNRTFEFYETLTSCACTTLFSTVYIMILPFISLYTKGIEDTNYYQPLFGCLITLAAEIYCLRLPYQSMISAAGHFKQTRIGAYGEAGINVTISILLVWKLGLVGVAIGTIVAIFFRLLYSVLYLKKNILKRSTLIFVRRTAINIGTTLTICFICNFVIKEFEIENYRMWILCAFITVLVSMIITILFNYIFYKDATSRALKITSSKLLRNSEI